MTRRARTFLVFTSALVVTTGLLVACGDDTTDTRTRFDQPEASPDVTEASLPDTATDASAIETSVPDAYVAYDGAPTPTVECEAAPCAVRLVGGQRHYCAVLSDDTVRCWGEPPLLGGSPESLDAGPDGTPGATPAVVEGVRDVVDIAASWDRTCAVASDGGVDCWGADEPTPTRIVVPTSTGKAARIAVSNMQGDGTRITCAVSPDGEPVCWGSLLWLLETDPAVFTLPDGKARSFALSWGLDGAMTDTGFVVDEQGYLLSWGGMSPLLLGREKTGYLDYVPRRVFGMAPIRSASAAASHACAITVDGHLYCWGAAGEAMLGVGYLGDEKTPVEVAFPEGSWPTDVSAGFAHSCARSTEGTVRCWGGHNRFGERGTQPEDYAYTPQPAQGTPADVVSVATGFYSTCVLTRGGAVWCWGYNGYGVLGNGTRDQDRHPVPAPVVFP